jgi:hypothetical protein
VPLWKSGGQVPPVPDGQDVHTELSAALADLLGRLVTPHVTGCRLWPSANLSKRSPPSTASPTRRCVNASPGHDAACNPSWHRCVHADGRVMAPRLPTMVHLAVLAELHPASDRPDRIHGVLAWTEDGARHYHPLPLDSDPHRRSTQPDFPFGLDWCAGPDWCTGPVFYRGPHGGALLADPLYGDDVGPDRWPPGRNGLYGWSDITLEIRDGAPILYLWAGQIAG